MMDGFKYNYVFVELNTKAGLDEATKLGLEGYRMDHIIPESGTEYARAVMVKGYMQRGDGSWGRSE